MTILLIRHGETPLNAARVMQPPDTPLSERGIAQALALAQRLGEAPLAGILSSDLRRAHDTAQAVAARTRLPVQTTPLLHERNFGRLRGQPYDHLGFNPFEMQEAPPEGESIADFLARVAQAFESAVRLRARLDGPLAVVTHGLVIKAILRGHVRLPEGVTVPDRIGNTSISVLDASPPHALSLLDCVTHLDGKLLEDGSSLSGG
ncbi:MAG: histidine phosphatase family protein [Burkholderiales bacterium]